MLGTAGHVDHGKSALVKLLTGCDTDTLAEEKQRGLTIDLGFAPCRFADERIVGVVDVPGHVDFIRNMVAGPTALTWSSSSWRPTTASCPKPTSICTSSRSWACAMAWWR